MAIDNCSFDAIPLVQSESQRRPNLNNLNYTNQDFWSMKARLVQFIRERFADDFNDFVESDLAIMLIENWAFIADTLSFKMDQIANEIFIDTVAEVENAFRLSRLVGFVPTPPISARAFFSASINQVLTTDLVISTPIGIDLTSNNTPIRYELFPADPNGAPLFDQDVVIPAGQFTNTQIVGVEGRTITETFVGTGEPNQTLELQFFPVILDSIRVDIDGSRWEQVDFFTDGNPRREYRVEFGNNFSGFVIFGDNQGGQIPQVGSDIVVTYRTGGGTVGNIVTNAINIQRQEVVPGFDFGVTVTYTNFTNGEFGYNGDGVEEIRRKLPAFLETQNRAVTGTDYKTLTDQFATTANGQVGKSTAVLRNSGCAGNIIDLYILAREGNNGLQEAEDGLKILLNEELEQKKMLTDFVCIKDGVVITVDVVIDVILSKFFKKFKEEIEARIDRRIDNFFNLELWEYNKDLRDGDIIKVLSDINEIDRVEVTLSTSDPDNSGNIVTTKFFEIIRPGDITVNFIFE